MSFNTLTFFNDKREPIEELWVGNNKIYGLNQFPLADIQYGTPEGSLGVFTNCRWTTLGGAIGFPFGTRVECYVLDENKQAKIQRVVTGLQPNRTVTFSIWAFINQGGNLNVGLEHIAAKPRNHTLVGYGVRAWREIFFTGVTDATGKLQLTIVVNSIDKSHNSRVFGIMNPKLEYGETATPYTRDYESYKKRK